MKNIIYGGSFNPIHKGHTAVAEKLLEYGDNVWIMPCYIHNFNKELLDFTHRKHMCDLAVIGANNPKLYVSAYEKFKKHENCTYLTVQHMKNISPEEEFAIAIGSDCAGDIHKWKYSDKLIADNQFIVFNRIGYSPDLSWMKPTDVFIEEPVHNVSSTFIRKMLETFSPEVEELLDPRVSEYIHENKLYGTGNYTFVSANHGI